MVLIGQMSIRRTKVESFEGSQSSHIILVASWRRQVFVSACNLSNLIKRYNSKLFSHLADFFYLDTPCSCGKSCESNSLRTQFEIKWIARWGCLKVDWNTTAMNILRFFCNWTFVIPWYPVFVPQIIGSVFWFVIVNLSVRHLPDWAWATPGAGVATTWPSRKSKRWRKF